MFVTLWESSSRAVASEESSAPGEAPDEASDEGPKEDTGAHSTIGARSC